MLLKHFRPLPVSPAVKAEQIRLVYAQSVTIQLLGVVTGLVAISMFWQVASHFWLTVWGGCHLALSLVRLSITTWFAKRAPDDQASIAHWGPVYVAGTALSGLVWGCLSLFFEPGWPAQHQITLFAIYTGVTAGAFNTNTPHFVAFPAFYLPAVGILSYTVLALPEDAWLQLNLLLLIYVALMYASALKFHNRLAHSLEIRFENERLVKQLAESNRMLAHIADNDALTGIPNRRAMDRHLGSEWNRHCRSGQPLSLLFIDIDYFKQYNDTYGHEGGDHCLVRVAELLRRQVQRTGEMVARFGGEEFAVILPETDGPHALTLAESIRAALEQQCIPHAGSAISDFLTLSVGVASIVPDLGHAMDDLRQNADLALYEAKKAGRNTVVCRPPILADSPHGTRQQAEPDFLATPCCPDLAA